MNQALYKNMASDNKHQCKHYLYRGEAIFYGIETVSRTELKFIFDNESILFKRNGNDSVQCNEKKG